MSCSLRQQSVIQKKREKKLMSKKTKLSMAWQVCVKQSGCTERGLILKWFSFLIQENFGPRFISHSHNLFLWPFLYYFRFYRQLSAFTVFVEEIYFTENSSRINMSNRFIDNFLFFRHSKIREWFGAQLCKKNMNRFDMYANIYIDCIIRKKLT